ncbi:hypothetical protein [Catenuloplanes atrovinosus]|uniref:Uncharacterized protein n=1 Tax=Catenuloplanes atrovinosus TaxID=137266 RepID=A0AAE3YPP4_9ACTN|nr:hypothetical protein [Catenuloplanes atrovinosus]MDR7277733.1 hypothetical protein [Catenuloplanes atrovinosus]
MSIAEHRRLRILRDIRDGHITVTARVAWFDPDTGTLLDEPVVYDIGADRAVGLAPGWWDALIADGLLELQAHTTRYTLTATATALLTDAAL